MFVLMVACELFECKHNIEIGFPSKPSIDELFGHCEATLHNERMCMLEQRAFSSKKCSHSDTPKQSPLSPLERAMEILKHKKLPTAATSPPTKKVNPPVTRLVIQYVLMFDDVLQRWVNLVSDSQLIEFSQVYVVFDPMSDSEGMEAEEDFEDRLLCGEEQEIIPPPSRLRDLQMLFRCQRELLMGVFEGHSASPVRARKRSLAPRAIPSAGLALENIDEVGAAQCSPLDHLFLIFRDIDINGIGFVSLLVFQRFFNVMGIYEFSEQSVEQLFVQFDANRDQRLSYAEFVKLCDATPNFVDIVTRSSREYLVAYKHRRPQGTPLDSSDLSAEEISQIQGYLEQRRTEQTVTPFIPMGRERNQQSIPLVRGRTLSTLFL